MRIDLKNGGIVATNTCDLYDAYILIIDKEEKSIDVSDQKGMMIGRIMYEKENVETLEYDSNGHLDDTLGKIIIKEGEIVWNKEN